MIIRILAALALIGFILIPLTCYVMLTEWKKPSVYKLYGWFVCGYAVTAVVTMLTVILTYKL